MDGEDHRRETAPGLDQAADQQAPIGQLDRRRCDRQTAGLSLG
jgi:hypothetical protein